jgi:hypothetical protein
MITPTNKQAYASRRSYSNLLKIQEEGKYLMVAAKTGARIAFVLFGRRTCLQHKNAAN